MKLSRLALLPLAAALALTAGCMSPEPAGLAPSQPAKTTVKVDFWHKPLPEVPLPNDLATRYDPTSPTGRRINASVIAPTGFESHVREKLDNLDGWGLYQPITIPFTGPISINSILKAHRDKNYDLKDDVIYLINVDPDSPDQGKFMHLDVGNGNFPVVVEDMDGYWKNDPRGDTISVLFEEHDEDTNKNGKLDPGEDTDLDGILDEPNYLPNAKPAADDLAARADALMTFYEKQSNTLIVRSMMPLDERTTYAVVITRRLRDADGEPVGSPFPFINHESQTEVLRGIEAPLATLGLGLDDVAFAFSFTTQTVQSDFVAVREGLYGQGVQKHLGEEFPADFVGFELLRDKAFEAFKDIKNPYIVYNEDFIEAMSLIADAFMGGKDNPSEKNKLLDSFGYVDYQLVASYESPQLFDRVDSLGRPLGFNDQSWPQDLTTTPAKARSETVYAHILIPRKEVSARKDGKPAPAVFMGHGYTGSRFDAVQLGPYLARHGLAVIGIDCVSHGLGLSDKDFDQASQLLGLYGLSPYLEAVAHRTRSADLNNDGTRDSGGDFWTSYLFHTRDVVRQSAVDHMQLVRILRSFDGKRRWDFDLNGDGEKDIAGDFDGDGKVDIGGDAPVYITGASLGGIMAVVVAAVEPGIKGTAPIAGGGGLADIGNRSKQGGVREALQLRVMGPLFVGTTAPGATTMTLETIIPDVNDTGTVAIGTVDGIGKGDVLVAENLVNGERGCSPVWEDEDGTLRVRVGVASDVGDPVRLLFYSGDAPVTGSEDCAVKEGKEPIATVDRFTIDTKFQGILYDKGTTLVSFAEGLGLRRASPDLRRFMGIGQLVLDAGDPGVLAPNLMTHPMEFPLLGEKTGAHTLAITTVGDMNVPANSGVAIARSAGLVDFLNDDPRYDMPVNQKLLETYTMEAVDTLKRYTTPAGVGVHMDVDNFSGGLDPFGTDVPRVDPPVRASMDGTDPLGGKSAAVFPYSNPTGQHGFDLPGSMGDKVRKKCQEECTAANPGDPAADCGCATKEVFDVGQFMMNMIGRYFASGGKTLDADRCQSRDDCGDVQPIPPARDKAM